MNRLVEFVALEHPKVRTFALPPGYLPTRIAAETDTLGIDGERAAGVALNTLALPAATMLYLTSGRADWLSGRFCSANWDMEEVVRGHLSAVIFDLRVTPDCS
jgi:hypothetical protein